MKALKDFYASEKRLPVSGIVPDMVSTTELFLELQKVYVTQANKDREAIANLVTDILKNRTLPPETVSQDELILFCKNCAQV